MKNRGSPSPTSAHTRLEGGWREKEQKSEWTNKRKNGKLRLLGLGRQLEGTNRLTWTIWDAILRWMLIGWMLASGNTQEKYLHLLPRRILGPPSPTTNAHLSTLFLLLFSLFIFFFFSWNLCFMFFFFFHESHLNNFVSCGRIY